MKTNNYARTIHSEPYIIERDREIETDNGNYDVCEQYEVYLTDYRYTPPIGRCLHQCDTPDEWFGDEDYEFIVLDEDGNEVSVDLIGDEEAELLRHFYRLMGD